MYLHQFHRLSARAQLLTALLDGTYLTSRSDAAGPVALYHVANQAQGFFVEVRQDQQAGFAVLHSFHDPLLLDEYVLAVPLPAGLGRR